jgi:hypothetical protein
MTTPACMGGWCSKRQHCPQYHAESLAEPSERLCEPGHDGESPLVRHHFHPQHREHIASQVLPADMGETL